MISEYFYDPRLIGSAGLVILLLFLLRKKKSDHLEGRGKIVKIIKRLGTDYALYQDIVIPVQGGMSHIDYVLASPYGIFVIDIRMEVGTIDGNVNAREWRVGKKDTIYNPVWRNRGYINGLEIQFGGLPIESLVVFPCAKLKGEFGFGVVVPDEMTDFIKRNGKVRVSSEQLKFVKEILEPLQRKKKRKKAGAKGKRAVDD